MRKPRNLGDLDLDLSRSLEFKCDGAIGLPMHGFLFMVNVTVCVCVCVCACELNSKRSTYSGKCSCIHICTSGYIEDKEKTCGATPQLIVMIK